MAEEMIVCEKNTRECFGQVARSSDTPLLTQALLQPPLVNVVFYLSLDLC